MNGLRFKLFTPYDKLSSVQCSQFSEFIRKENEGRKSITTDPEFSLNSAMDLESGGGFVMTMYKDKALAGIVVLKQLQLKSELAELQLDFIVVRKSLRRQGIGSLLMKYAIKFCPGNIAISLDSASPFIEFFEKSGFEADGIFMRLCRQTRPCPVIRQTNPANDVEKSEDAVVLPIRRKGRVAK